MIKPTQKTLGQRAMELARNAGIGYHQALAELTLDAKLAALAEKGK